MKILMLLEYFTPYDSGGSEWSAYYLAKGLSTMGVDVTILTPNYGNAKESDILEGMRVVRFPFYVKLKGKNTLTPYWQTNILWIIWTSFFVIKYCLTNNIDIIHIQGKYFLPAGVFARVLLGKKVVITLRDYIILCPLGMCLLRGNKICNLRDYFSKNLKEHIQVYQYKKSNLYKFLLFLAAARAKIVSLFLRKLLNFVDKKIAVSEVTKKIYFTNGVSDTEVIPNLYFFKKVKRTKAKNMVIFAGRLTPGKGVNLLIDAIPGVLLKYPDLIFLICGEGFLKEELFKRTKELGIAKNVKFLGYVEHQKLVNYYLTSVKAAIAPSVWPEPFGRFVLESLAIGTPVLISGRHGLVDNFKNKKWGIIKKPQIDEITKGIIFIIDNYQQLRTNLNQDMLLIKKMWYSDVLNAHINVYRSLMSKNG